MIRTQDGVITVCSDICGNIYLGIEGIEELYQINVDNKDGIYLEKGIYRVIDSKSIVMDGLIPIDKEKEDKEDSEDENIKKEHMINLFPENEKYMVIEKERDKKRRRRSPTFTF